MSGHRRVKDVDFDEDEFADEYDEYDEYEEGEHETSAQAADVDDGMSPEEKEQMRQGTIKVRAALGDQDGVSDDQIQEALWHYWFDATKATVYLKSMSFNLPYRRSSNITSDLKEPKQQKQTPKKKQESRFDQAASVAATVPANPKNAHMDPADWFKDVPWFNVPQSMTGRIVEPVRPPLRLLGGSAPTGGKTSKLAALAAARKQKELAAKENAIPPVTTSLLDRLGTKGPAPARPATEPAAVPEPVQEKTYPIRKRKSPSPPPQPRQERIPSNPGEQSTLARDQPPRQDIRTKPSIFAKTMIGQRQDARPLSQDYKNNLQTTLYGHFDHTETNPFAGPSPDDVVTQAQAKGSKNKKADKSAKSVTDGVADLSVEDESTTPTKVKRRSIDVVAEYGKSGRKQEASFVVIGHVDHGKSTLMGRLLLDLKLVDQRSVDKYKKEASKMGKSSFALAWVMDSTEEERQRGVTVDIATNYFETEKTKFTILDAPGHRDFIPNMIAGASQADFAVLVIDASTNSFEAGLRGQTKEHALLVRSMGVAKIIVAVNKMDTVTWSHDRFEEIQQQVSAFMISTGFKADNITFVPCAGLTGENIVAKPPQAGSWYSGQTLVQALEAFEPSKTAMTQPFRMQISDVFRGGFSNPVSISGRIESGTVQVGDKILAMPASEMGIIKGIEIDNQSQDWAVAGQIVDLHLNDIDPMHLRAGDIVCNTQKPVKNVKSFTTKLLAFEHILPMHVDVHRGRLHVPARITALVSTLDKTTGAVVKNKPKVVQPGTVARVRVELDSAIPLEIPQRIVLRAAGATVAAGLLETVYQ